MSVPVRSVFFRYRLVAVGFCALAITLLTVSPASAHARLETVAPANESTVSSMPTEVVLRFDEPVALDLGAGIRVFGPTGRRVDRSVSRLRDLAKAVTVSVDDAGPGSYTVAWRVVSEDSHVLRGSSVFHVRTKTGAVGITSTPPKSLAWLGWFARFLALGAATTLFGVALTAAVVLGKEGARLRRVAMVAGVALIIGAGLRFAVQVALASGRGLLDAVGLWGDSVSSTRPGTLDAWRVAAALIALVGVVRWSKREGPRIAAVGSIAAMITNSLGGHAWTAATRAATVALDVVHQGAAAAWAGGLVALLVVLRVAPEQTAEFVARFGRIALLSAGLLLATGAWASFVHVGSIGALMSTGYGRLVVAKFIGFGLMGPLGWTNRRRLASLVSAARSTLRLEVSVAALVLAVTASLVGAVPVQGGSRDPFYTRVETATMAVDVTVLPAKVGLNTMHLYFYDSEGNPDRVDVATARVAIADIPPRRINLLPITGDHFSAGGFTLPTKGVWTLTLNMQRQGKTESFTIEVPVK